MADAATQDFPPKSVDISISFPSDINDSHLGVCILKLVSSELNMWSDSSVYDLRITKCTGGLSNVVLKVENQKDSSALLVRLFGSGSTNTTIRQQIEACWMSVLASLGGCPKVLLEFSNGRIEQFLNGHHPLSIEDVRNPYFSARIAKTMAFLHKNTHLIAETTSNFVCPTGTILYSNQLSIFNLILSDFSSLSVSYTEFFGQAYHHFNGLVLDCLSFINIHVDEFRHFFKLMITMLEGSVQTNVFIHGDLLNSNIMYSSADPDKVIFIDYEYAGFGSRALDIANHFCEWMNCFSTSRPYYQNFEYFPEKEQIITFIQIYLSELDKELDVDVWLKSIDEDDLVNEILFFCCVAAIRWTLWAIIQFKSRTRDLSPACFQVSIKEIDNVDNPFFYILYAKHKFEHYNRLKTTVLEKITAHIEGGGDALHQRFPLTFQICNKI